MAADPFRQRMNHDVRPIFDGVQQVRRRERSVDRERKMMLLRDLRYRFEIRHVKRGIADRFAE